MTVREFARAAIKLFARNRSYKIDGWKYEYAPIKGGMEVTITNPEGHALRPVLMPRSRCSWFRHE